MVDGRRRLGKRTAALGAGVVLLGSLWGGAALAQEDGNAPADPARCNALTQQLATAQQELATALGSVGGSAKSSGAQEETEQADELTQQASAACSPAATQQTAGQRTATQQQTVGQQGLVPQQGAQSTGITAGAPGAAGLAAAGDRDCPSFTSQAEAQAYFTQIGGSAANNADRLDADGDGLACEDTKYAATAVGGGYNQVSAVPSGGIDTGDGSTAP
jgi:hypothetical protein